MLAKKKGALSGGEIAHGAQGETEERRRRGRKKRRKKKLAAERFQNSLSISFPPIALTENTLPSGDAPKPITDTSRPVEPRGRRGRRPGETIWKREREVSSFS